MHRADDAVLRVAQEHGHAVGREAEDGQARRRGHDPVGLIGNGREALMPVRLRHDAHRIAVHLPRHGAVVLAHAEEGGDAAVVFAHVLRLVPLVAEEIQRRQMSAAHAAVTGGEGVAQGDDVRSHVNHAVFVVFNKHTAPFRLP